jgi:drug/metabolite transporter (DMT)-like permease
MMKVPGYAMLAAASGVFLLAASLSRIYAGGGRTPVVVAAMALYVVGNLLMIHVMRAFGLGIAISASTVVQLILVNVVAFVFFGERPAPLQLAGMALGLVSMTLILLPANGR